MFQPDKVTIGHLESMKATYGFSRDTKPAGIWVNIAEIDTKLQFHREFFEGAEHEDKVLPIAVLHALKADRPQSIADQMAAKDRKIAALEEALKSKGVNADGVHVKRAYNKTEDKKPTAGRSKYPTATAPTEPATV